MTGAAALPRLPVADRATMGREIVVLADGRKARLTAILLLLLVAAASTLVLPLTIGWIVDTVARGDGAGIPAVFWWQLSALAAAAVVGGVLEYLGVVALGRVVDTMAAELREKFVSAALDLASGEIERVGVGDVVTRAATDTRNVSEELPGVLPTVVSAAFTVVLVALGTAAIDWRFLPAFVLAVPLYAGALRWYLPAVPPVYAALRSADSTRGERVLTTLGALPTVTAFGTGPGRAAGIRAATWEVGRWEVRARIMQNRFFGRINVAELTGLLLVLGCGFLLASRYGVSLGQVTAASLLFLQVTGSISSLMYVMDDLQSAAASLARVVGVTAPAPGGPPAGASRPAVGPTGPPGPPGGAVVHLEDVRFAYRPGRPVIDGVSLSLAAGEHLAVVGPSGSGKTTLARLVAGARAPDGGRVTTVARNRIASLDQESHVFSATLRDNLALAAPGTPDDALREALVAVGGAGLLSALPQGLDTPLGAEGHRLTGAEAQVLSLARLMLHDPDVAVLDEATAEADSRTAGLLARASETALRGRAAIVIAHRLTQAAVCDRILVLEAGRVVEEGTHGELLAADGRYARLWEVYRGRG